MLNWIIQLLDYILVPFNMQKERIFILKSAKTIFKELKLKPIPIVYDNTYSCYYDTRGHIGISSNFLKREDWDSVFNYIKAEFKSREDKLFFIIAHEISHHLQNQRHIDWKNHWVEKDDIYFLTKFGMISSEKYRTFKIEANADKIALLLSKKYNHCITT